MAMHNAEPCDLVEYGVCTNPDHWIDSNDDAPVAQQQWVHKDGSLCPSWEECDTYEHTSLDGNETVARIKSQPLVEPDDHDEEFLMWEQAERVVHYDDEIIYERCVHDRPVDMFCADCSAKHEHTSQCMHGCTEELTTQRDGNVGELIDGRVDVYGDPVKVFPRHAQIWSGILGIEVQPWQVALCMMGYKLGRTAITPDYSDNVDDIDGYEDIFRTLIGDEMIQARDTKAYIAGGGKGART